MLPDDIRDFSKRQPFRVTLTDGQSHEVVHPDLVMISRNTITIGVTRQGERGGTYDRVVTISMSHVMQIEPILIDA